MTNISYFISSICAKSFLLNLSPTNIFVTILTHKNISTIFTGTYHNPFLSLCVNSDKIFPVQSETIELDLSCCEISAKAEQIVASISL